MKDAGKFQTLWKCHGRLGLDALVRGVGKRASIDNLRSLRSTAKALQLLPMSNLPEQTTPVYATDEDIAVRAGGDFVMLCPPWQQMASGVDGVFGADAPWVLDSASVNFQSNGVTPNQVVQLTTPGLNTLAAASCWRSTPCPVDPSRCGVCTKT